MTSIKVQQARKEIAALSARFRNRELLDARFYEQLESHGCGVDNCVLIELVPDGADTYFGNIIRQDGRVFAFDLALGAPSASEWVEQTERFLDEYRRLRISKPWLPGVVAYEMFLKETRHGEGEGPPR